MLLLTAPVSAALFEENSPDTSATEGTSATGPETSLATTESPVPTIVSDQPDYPPGGRVTLTGENWQGDTTVHVVVNDTLGMTWSYETDAEVQEDGTISVELWIAYYFISDYDVVATGNETGRVARTTFTDTRRYTGTVFHDADGDGTQDPGEVGISGIGVRVYLDSGSIGTLDASDSLRWSGTTNTSGFYDTGNNVAGNNDRVIVAIVKPLVDPSAFTQTLPINATSGRADCAYDSSLFQWGYYFQQSGNTDYTRNFGLRGSIPITVTAHAKTKVYGADDPAFTYTYTGALQSGDSFSGALSRVAGEAAGVYPINQGTLSLRPYYTISYTGADLTITKATLSVNATAQSKTYGDPDPTLTYTFSGFKFDDHATNSNITGTASISRGPGEAVAGSPYTISVTDVSGLSAPNYQFAIGSTANFTITRAPLTVSATSDTKVYDGTTDSSAVPIVSGLKGSDSVTGLSQAFQSKDVLGPNGSTLVVTGYTVNDGASGNNYAVSLNTATGTITPKPVTGWFTAADKPYDGTTSATIVDRGLIGLIPGDVVNLGGGNATFASADPGTWTVTLNGAALSGTDRDNYSLVLPVTTTATIYRINVTITGAVAQDKVYDGTTAATVDFSGATLVGVVSGHDVTIDASTYSASFDTKDVGSDKPVTVSGVKLAGANAGMYTLTQPSGLTADITPAPLTVAFVAEDKVYDGTTEAVIHSPSITAGIVDAEEVTVEVAAGAKGTFASKNVGTWTVTAEPSDFVLGGADAGNYEISTVTATTARILYGMSDSFFLPPINTPGHGIPVSVFKAGSTIPVKFQVFDAFGTPIDFAVATISFWKYSAVVPSGEEEMTVASQANTGILFRYDPISQQYIFNLSTKGFPKGNYFIRVTLDSGQQPQVNIGLK